MAEEPQGRILVLEDDEGVSELIRRRLERLGYAVVSATRPDEALAVAQRRDIDLVVLDYLLRGHVSGLEFYRKLEEDGLGMPAILITGFQDEERLVEAIRAGVRDFVPKTPYFLDDLPKAVERVMTQVRVRRQADEAASVRNDNIQLQALIEERRRLESELRDSNERLLDADRRKNEFIAMLAHELRNPLAAIGNCLRLMRASAAVEHAEWCREVIERQTHHLGRLIEDLLDVSRITHGKIELRRQETDLGALIERAVAAMRPLMDSRSHTLTARMESGPLPMDADPTRIEQVLVNLLNNAAKYTDPGGRISLEAWPEGAEAVVTVSDNGIGLAADVLPHVFDPFLQVDHSLNRSEGGLGIGLTLVKRLVELHGGKVTACSDGPGKGSVFEVRLPMLVEAGGAAGGSKGRGAESAVSTGRPRVLVVDDNVDTAKAMSLLLSESGYEVRVAHQGREALEAAREMRPEFVLLDIGLPEMDGYQVARAIRREGGKALLVAISGYAAEEDRRRSAEAGFDRHLVKPVDFDEVVGLLREARGS